MALPAKHVWLDMEAVIPANSTQDELPPDDDALNAAFLEYDPNTGVASPALPTLAFEGVNYLEDPISLPSVQVSVSLPLIFPFWGKTWIIYPLLVLQICLAAQQYNNSLEMMGYHNKKNIAFIFIYLNEFA